LGPGKKDGADAISKHQAVAKEPGGQRPERTGAKREWEVKKFCRGDENGES